MLYHSQNLFGSWVRGQSAGGCRNNSSFPTNPKFWLRVCEKSEVCIALLQKHRKYSADWAGRIQNLTHLVEKNLSLTEGMQVKNYQAVGLHVWKVIWKWRFSFCKKVSKHYWNIWLKPFIFCSSDRIQQFTYFTPCIYVRMIPIYVTKQMLCVQPRSELVLGSHLWVPRSRTFEPIPN